ncbi:hypothetical protein [Alteromonas sp. A079]|uniref:hypothetical protein n=1 Tax=Alteromonas sp. A079 TaxID=3410268 RepID=UPI003BA2B6D4
MKAIKVKPTELRCEELSSVSGAGFFYELGALFAQQANISDSIRRQYGNTNKNHW